MDFAQETARPRTGDGRGVVEGAFLVLAELARLGEAGPSQLASATGLHKATVHRLLNQLVAVAAVRRRDGRYRIGSQLFRLGQTWKPAEVLRAAAQRPVRELAAASQLSVGIAVPDEGQPLFVGAVPARSAEVLSVRTGMTLSADSAAGLAIVAFAPLMPPPADHSSPAWARLLDGVRERGVAVHHADDQLPMTCLAAPVHAPHGAVVASIGAVAPAKRHVAPLAEAVRRAAGMASATLARLPAGRELFPPS
ncbi:IclR family transcriptional regulator [Amycolatopsis sp. WGS_07]|uniref:IclR family transcriptional regulator n=1 Tax=Amycolatopsis sp. WGS_07 TaxID=3076764 RepID=UPI0038737849